MFDAKALLEQIAGNAQRPAASPAAGPGGGLADLLSQIAAGGQGAGSGSGTGLDQVLGQFRDQAGKLGFGSGSDILDTLGKVLGQATEGAKEGAGRVGDATGARDALTKAAGGRTPDELIAQVKDLIAKNEFGAGAVLGGLGGLLLGTRTGRGLATGAVKLGALALIGGLAYKAYQNYEAGRPLITGPQGAATAAPLGSGFEPDAITNEGATLIIRAMIAAAAADGRVDDTEHGRIVSSLGGAAANPEARAFLDHELRAPASAAALAAAVRSPEEALQVYTAARIAIDPDSAAEAGFLSELAAALRIEPGLAAQIDATARNTAG